MQQAVPHDTDLGRHRGVQRRPMPPALRRELHELRRALHPYRPGRTRLRRVEPPLRPGKDVPPGYLSVTSVAPPPWTATRGAKLDGRYELEEQIGVGGMGEVWRARHL